MTVSERSTTYKNEVTRKLLINTKAVVLWYYIKITIIQSYKQKYIEFVAVVLLEGAAWVSKLPKAKNDMLVALYCDDTDFMV